MKHFTLILTLLQLFACNEKPSNWDNPEFSELDFEPNTLKVENYTINGTPLKTSKAELLANLGEPEEVFEQKNIRISQTDSVDFQIFHFKNGNLIFNNHKDSVTGYFGLTVPVISVVWCHSEEGVICQ